MAEIEACSHTFIKISFSPLLAICTAPILSAKSSIFNIPGSIETCCSSLDAKFQSTQNAHSYPVPHATHPRSIIPSATLFVFTLFPTIFIPSTSSLFPLQSTPLASLNYHLASLPVLYSIFYFHIVCPTGYSTHSYRMIQCKDRKRICLLPTSDGVQDKNDEEDAAFVRGGNG